MWDERREIPLFVLWDQRDSPLSAFHLSARIWNGLIKGLDAHIERELRVEEGKAEQELKQGEKSDYWTFNRSGTLCEWKLLFSLQRNHFEGRVHYSIHPSLSLLNDQTHSSHHATFDLHQWKHIFPAFTPQFMWGTQIQYILMAYYFFRSINPYCEI